MPTIITRATTALALSPIWLILWSGLGCQIVSNISSVLETSCSLAVR